MDDFEYVKQEYETIIYHLIHKYQIRDVEGEFYQEGLIALWQAYQQYDESKSKFPTYAYYCIARCFLNKIQKENREKNRLKGWLAQVRMEDLMMVDDCVVDSQMIEEIQGILTANQWKWFELFVLQDQSVKTIANSYGVTENAVKNWGKLARKKVRVMLREREFVV